MTAAPQIPRVGDGLVPEGLSSMPAAVGDGPVPPVSQLRFGPSALATWANAATVARVALAVPLLNDVVRGGSSWWVWAQWTALASSDGLDGWLARRQGATRSGAFLDPLADKFLVLGGLGALAARGAFPRLPVAVIASREVGVSLYRSAVGRRGVSLPARGLGKAKTIGQLLAVGSVLFPPTATSRRLQVALIWGVTGLTVVSGVDVIRASRRAQPTPPAGNGVRDEGSPAR
ncbi:MAG: CDP-alcohol phosphatidyltransferase family protein [Acidimicrobiia bacterium]